MGLNRQPGFVNGQILTDPKVIAITSALLPNSSRLLVNFEGFILFDQLPAAGNRKTPLWRAICYQIQKRLDVLKIQPPQVTPGRFDPEPEQAPLHSFAMSQ